LLPKETQKLVGTIGPGFRAVLGCIKVDFMEAGRLSTVPYPVTGDAASGGPTIEDLTLLEACSLDFVDWAKQVSRQAASHHQTLEQASTRCALTRYPAGVEACDELRSEYERLAGYGARLAKVGLHGFPTLEEIPNGVLNLALRSLFHARHVNADRLVPLLDPMLCRCESFTRMASSLLRREELKLDAHRGIVVVPHWRRTLIPLRTLSTGEQYVLALLFSLHFRVPDGSMVVIDGPESALDERTQERLIPYLLEIGMCRDLRIVITTRSPKPYLHPNRTLIELRPEGPRLDEK